MTMPNYFKQNLTIFLIITGMFLVLITSCQSKDEDASPVSEPEVGQTAVDFTLLDVNDMERSLSDYRGQLVVLHFWASWCSYCKAENPNLVVLHNAYKQKGFKVLAFSLDTNKDKWLAGITNENLNFDHVSDFKGFESPIVKMYDAGSIPYMFLIDENGVIMEISNRTIDIAAKVAQHYR
jgi:peroxiredoxin